MPGLVYYFICYPWYPAVFFTELYEQKNVYFPVMLLTKKPKLLNYEKSVCVGENGNDFQTQRQK